MAPFRAAALSPLRKNRAVRQRAQVLRTLPPADLFFSAARLPGRRKSPEMADFRWKPGRAVDAFGTVFDYSMA